MTAVTAPLDRRSDLDVFGQALHMVQQSVGLPVVFGGEICDGVLCLSVLRGLRTRALAGLRVPAGSGLGGRVVALGKLWSVADYTIDRSITHDYDRPVLAEGLRSQLAVPVMVAGRVRGVLYGAARVAIPIGDHTTDLMVRAAHGLAAELAIRDEVDRRLALIRAAEGNRARQISLEEVRDVHAEMRGIAARVDDPRLRTRLRELCERLARLDRDALSPTGANGLGDGTSRAGSQPGLSMREVDVLAHVAVGCANAEIAERLGLSAETVKAYLRSARYKLDARNRLEAVVAARRRGLLP